MLGQELERGCPKREGGKPTRQKQLGGGSLAEWRCRSLERVKLGSLRTAFHPTQEAAAQLPVNSEQMAVDLQGAGKGETSLIALLFQPLSA